MEEIYRDPKPMNFRLLSATNVWFDHGEYSAGFEQLTNLIAAGNSNVDAQGEVHPVFAPSHQQLSLAATLIVHPDFSTRAKSSEQLGDSDNALRFLRHVHRVVGPVKSNFSEAFSLQHKTLPSARRGSAKKSRQDPDSPGEDEDSNGLSNPYGNGKSVFAQVEDIWSIVGWAFNCSVVHKNRWARWRLLLELMLEIFESDLRQRYRIAGNGADWISESIAAQILQSAQDRSGCRRLMRAILADGSEKAVNEFGEVFKNETKERKKEPVALKARKPLNIDEDKWGDYDVREDEDEVMIDAEWEQLPEPDTDENDTDIDANNVRQRFLALMAMVAEVPGNKFASLETLLDLYTEFYRPMPFEQFRRILQNTALPTRFNSALLANTILPFLTAVPARLNIMTLDQGQLITRFFPCPANSPSAIENAKLSLLVELLISNLIDEGRLQFSTDLFAAIRKGIEERSLKAIGDARRGSKGQTPEEEDAHVELRRSSERIMAYMEILRFDGESLSQTQRNMSTSSPLSTLSTQSTPRAE